MGVASTFLARCSSSLLSIMVNSTTATATIANATSAITSTIVSSSNKPKFRYLSAWFCPYAHRTTIALAHHKDRIEYEWVEALGWKQKQQEEKDNVDWYYHWKADELKRVNPSALVPTLIPYDPISGELKESEAVYESLVTIDYLDLVSGAMGYDRLIPLGIPYQTARCRIWADKVNKDCCSPYYGVLVRTDEIERKQHFDQLIQGLMNFSVELQKTSGPLFLPDGQLSIVDIALIPWAFRFYVLAHYRGQAFTIPHTRELEPYHTWYEYIIQIPAVARTLPDKDRYLDHIQKYADGSARSKVANAVRRGASAHEIDDKKDEY